MRSMLPAHRGSTPLPEDTDGDTPAGAGGQPGSQGRASAPAADILDALDFAGGTDASPVA